MNEKINKNAKVKQLTEMFLRRGEEKGLIVKDPFHLYFLRYFLWNSKGNMNFMVENLEY